MTKLVKRLSKKRCTTLQLKKTLIIINKIQEK